MRPEQESPSDVVRDQDAAAVGRALLKIIARKGRRTSAIRSLLLAELRAEPDLERLFAD